MWQPRVGRFRAEFFVLDREEYFRTSEEENGKSKQKLNEIKENRRFSTLKPLEIISFAKAKKLPSFLFAFMPKCGTLYFVLTGKRALQRGQVIKKSPFVFRKRSRAPQRGQLTNAWRRSGNRRRRSRSTARGIKRITAFATAFSLARAARLPESTL